LRKEGFPIGGQGKNEAPTKPLEVALDLPTNLKFIYEIAKIGIFIGNTET